MTIVNPTGYTAPGMGPLQVSDITSNNGQTLWTGYNEAITDVVLTRGITVASTMMIQLTDPFREILNAPGFFQNGDTVEIPDGFGNYLQFAFVEVLKEGDQLQVTFEGRSVYDLRQVHGILNNTSASTDAGSFVTEICNSINIPCVAPINDPYIASAYSLGSGTSYDPNEDAWTSFQRIASTLGWRCWESAGTIFFGPDEYWFNSEYYGIVEPPVNKYYNHPVSSLYEFTEAVQMIDYDYDNGSQFGDATITAMAEFWQWNPGEIVNLEKIGPASGPWMISGFQRDFFNPQTTVTATIPMPAQLVLTPPVLPIIGGRPIAGDSYQ